MSRVLSLDSSHDMSDVSQLGLGLEHKILTKQFGLVLRIFSAGTSCNTLPSLDLSFYQEGKIYSRFTEQGMDFKYYEY